MRIRSFVFAAALVILSTCPALAQPGAIMLYSDLAYTNCNLVDATVGLQQVFVVHNFTGGATASQFAVQECGPLTMTYLSWAAAHAVAIGNNPLEGVAVTYNGGCNAGPILVGTMSYFAQGTTPPCAYLIVVPDPVAVSGNIEGVDCNFNTTILQSGALTVSSDGRCYCSYAGPANPGPQPCYPVPVEETSWGKVKSLYQ